MRAVVIRSHGGPDVLEPTEVATPEPGVGEALLRVQAVSVNAFLDVSNRAGHVPFARYEFPHILGAEHAAEIVAFGPGVDSPLRVGDRVVVPSTIPCRACDACHAGNDEQCTRLAIIGVNRQGAYAEHTVVPAHVLRPIPNGVSFVEASALGVNGPLAVAQLMHAGAQPGDTVLVQGAGSSAGSMALLVARAMGMVTIGTTRTAAKVAQLEALKLADHLVVSTEPHAIDTIKGLTGGRGVDVVIDNLASPELWPLTMGALCIGGRVVTSGAKFGGKVEIDVRNLYTFTQHIIGVRTSNDAAKDRHWKLVTHEGLRPLIDSTMPLDHAADAHRRIEAGENVGRLVLVV
jgi:NADPH:quinone reductase-like Zn-dependent oxidoreductase